MLTPAHHKKMLRDILGLNDDVIQHFDGGGTVLGGPTASGSSIPGSTSGVGGLGNLADPVPTSVSSHLPSSVAAGLNPLGALQSATQNNFVAQAPVLQQGTNAGQLNNAYGQVQQGIGAQQDLVNALSAQNGIGNQSSIYNQGQNLLNQQNAANGIGNQNQAAQGFANIANGTGPNVAQSQLNQSTGQNVANQAALMAGQRGASSNAGLAARQAAQQGGAIQQNAAGQAATLQAQQQQAALSNLGNLGSTQVGQQQAQQNNLANLATNQVNAVGQATTGLNTASQNEQNILQGANTAYNNANVSSQSNLNNVNAGVSENNQAASNNLLGGIMNGAGSVLSSLFAKGGEVTETHRILAAALQKRKMPEHLEHMAKIYHPKMFADGGEADGGEDVSADLGTGNYTAPETDSSPNIGSSTPVNEPNAFASSSGGGGGGGMGGGIAALAALAKGGAVVPGKPKVNKNSYSNDVVPAMLTPKEIVLPLSVTQSKNPGEAAKSFVEQIKGQSSDADFKKALQEHVKNRKSKKK